MKSQKNNPELSIVLPVYNEEKNIPLVIEKYRGIAKEVKLELIFVEDTGSKDDTRELLKKLAKKNSFVKPLFIKEKGYGISIYEGLKKSKGDFIGWTHADLQADPKDTLKALKLIKKQKSPKTTYVKGKRYGRTLFDSFFTFGMSIFETLYLRHYMYDINAQPNIFHRSFSKLMKKPPKDFSFDLYTYYLAKKNNYNIKKFSVYFGTRIHGHSAWNFGFKSKIRLIKRTMEFTFKLKRQLKNGF